MGMVFLFEWIIFLPLSFFLLILALKLNMRWLKRLLCISYLVAIPITSYVLLIYGMYPGPDTPLWWLLYPSLVLTVAPFVFIAWMIHHFFCRYRNRLPEKINMIATPKYLLPAAALFFLVTCTPIYELIFWPTTITVHGTLPPGMHIKSVTAYYTESPLCRNSSLISGKFARSSSFTSVVEAAADSDGQFEFEVPVGKNSLWCNWIDKSVELSVFYPSAMKDGIPRSIDIGGISTDETATSAPVTIQCAQTYYVFSRVDGTMTKIYRPFCRNLKLPSSENADYSNHAPEILIRPGAKEMTIHLLMETSGQIPVYDEHKGPANFWREFDAARNGSGAAATPATP